MRASIDRPDIVLLDGNVPPHHVKAMMELCDCYASLHRSEGFGLGMAEAMALGKPVVATAWSANLEFMDEESAYLIPAATVPIPAEVAVYGGLGRRPNRTSMPPPKPSAESRRIPPARRSGGSGPGPTWSGPAIGGRWGSSWPPTPSA